jgi:glycosyltransferase involved in cell wall biosynthesis
MSSNGKLPGKSDPGYRMATRWGIAVALLLAVAYLDYVTGYEVTVFVFYTIPIAYAAWNIGGTAGFLFAIGSTAAWLASDLSAGLHYSHRWILGENAAMRLILFLAVSFSVQWLKRLLLREKRRTEQLEKMLSACSKCCRICDAQGVWTEMFLVSANDLPSEGKLCPACIAVMAKGRNLRILHVIRSVDPRGGGPIEGVKQMSALNQGNGHSVEIASMDDPQDSGVTSCPLPCHAFGPSWLGYGYSRKFVGWLRKNRTRYDIVVVNGIWQYHAFGTWRALRGTDTPYFVFTHGMLDPWFKHTYPLKHVKKWLYWPWGDYRVLRDATAVFFTCEEERRLARESFWLYKCNEFVVNYGTNGPEGNATNQKMAFAKAFPKTREKNNLLFLGRVHVKKGVNLLLEAFADLLQETTVLDMDRWHIIMAGPHDHAYGQKMIALTRQLGLSARVTWTGMLTGDLKWGAIHNADAFVLPSHQENFGIAVAEALACGVPVLISNKVNVWREIVEDRAGFASEDNLDETKAMLKHWMTLSLVEKAAMRENARACFSKRFHIRQTAESFVAALHTFQRPTMNSEHALTW